LRRGEEGLSVRAEGTKLTSQIYKPSDAGFCMYCPSCGEEVSGDDGYCWHCGEEFPDGFPKEGAERRRTDPGSSESSEAKTPSSSDSTTIAALAHVLGLFTWILGPVVVYLIAEDDFVKKNAANALNWQVSLTIYLFVSAVLVFLLIGIALLFLLSILNLVFCVIATIKSAEEEAWEYPFAISFA